VTPAPADVQSSLERILSSDHFIHAERLSAFLRFAVERTLAGEGPALKEYLLGTEVFGRGTSFDPRLDPVVRVEARRLRAKLQEYYEGAGSGDPVRIVLRKGSYAPAFEAAPAVPEASAPAAYAPGRRFLWIGIAAAVVVAAIAGAVIASRTPPVPPAVGLVVIPADDAPEEQAFTDGVAESLAGELARNPRFRVVAWPRFLEYRGRRSDRATSHLGQVVSDLHADTVLWISSRRTEGRRKISAIWMKPDRGYKEWAGEFERGLTDDFAIQREIARSIADEVRNKN
jgi:adenylate cyclase